MRDEFAVIWTRTTGQPKKLADMVLTDQALRITKTEEAIALQIPGVSIIHDAAKFARIDYLRGSEERLPTQLETLVPHRDKNVPQFRLMQPMLDQRSDYIGRKVLEQKWVLLLLFGRGGIGHLDVFANDAEAEKYYARPKVAPVALDTWGAVWHAWMRVAEYTANIDDIDFLMSVIGVTPGVTGAVPKMLTSIDLSTKGWSGPQSLRDNVQAILKADSYSGLVLMEALALEVYREAGFQVPNSWTREVTHQGRTMRLLAVERFDRHPDGRPIPAESVYSILRTGNPTSIHTKNDGRMETVANLLGTVGLCRNPLREKKELFRRLVMALLTGNGDLHTENLTILGRAGDAVLSPVYDPAPMRLYRKHNLLSALPFSGVGGIRSFSNRNEYAESENTPPDLAFRLISFGKNIGLKSNFCRDTVAELLDATASFLDRARDVVASIPASESKAEPADFDGFSKAVTQIRESILAGHSLCVVRDDPLAKEKQMPGGTAMLKDNPLRDASVDEETKSSDDEAGSGSTSAPP